MASFDRHEPQIVRLLPDREPRARCPPGLHGFVIRPIATGEPFQKIEHERLDGFSHDPYLSVAIVPRSTQGALMTGTAAPSIGWRWASFRHGDAAMPRGSWSGARAPVYALTRICSVAYITRVESVFEIIAEPNRRAILSLLVSSQRSVGEIERRLRMPQSTVSKHLRVLREAGFVESTVDAQRRLYRLKPEPFQEVEAWLVPFRRFWSAHVDALERHLDRMDPSTRTTRKTKRKTRRRR